MGRREAASVLLAARLAAVVGSEGAPWRTAEPLKLRQKQREQWRGQQYSIERRKRGQPHGVPLPALQQGKLVGHRLGRSRRARGSNAYSPPKNFGGAHARLPLGLYPCFRTSSLSSSLPSFLPCLHVGPVVDNGNDHFLDKYVGELHEGGGGYSRVAAPGKGSDCGGEGATGP